jgi:hypothetical protein
MDTCGAAFGTLPEAARTQISEVATRCAFGNAHAHPYDVEFVSLPHQLTSTTNETRSDAANQDQ